MLFKIEINHLLIFLLLQTYEKKYRRVSIPIESITPWSSSLTAFNCFLMSVYPKTDLFLLPPKRFFRYNIFSIMETKFSFELHWNYDGDLLQIRGGRPYARGSWSFRYVWLLNSIHFNDIIIMIIKILITVTKLYNLPPIACLL